MKNMVDLKIVDGQIHAVFTGPHAQQVVELFGSPIIPTAYSEAYGIQNAAKKIRELNPGMLIYPLPPHQYQDGLCVNCGQGAGYGPMTCTLGSSREEIAQTHLEHCDGCEVSVTDLLTK